MNGPRQATEATSTDSTAKGSSLVVTLLHVAWLSVLLGLGAEALLLLLAVGSGLVPELGEIVAASVQKVSWAFIVCTGIAIGTTVSSALRTPLMGILGLFATPIAFHVARTLHQDTKEALEITGGIEEAFFPVGCSLVLFTAQALGNRLASEDEDEPS